MRKCSLIGGSKSFLSIWQVFSIPDQSFQVSIGQVESDSILLCHKFIYDRQRSRSTLHLSLSFRVITGCFCKTISKCIKTWNSPKNVAASQVIKSDQTWALYLVLHLLFIQSNIYEVLLTISLSADFWIYALLLCLKMTYFKLIRHRMRF